MQPTLVLPVRLVPRTGSQILAILFFTLFLGFAVFWTAMAASMIGEADWSEAQAPELWLSRLFPLFGLPFILIGAGGIVRAVLKMLPGSPYYHLEISADGLTIRSLFKQRRYSWRDLPPFETLERRRRTKNGIRIEHYTAAMQDLAPPAGARPGSTHRREVLRIFADEYGAKNGKQDADALAAWLNQLRDMAADHRLQTNAATELPEGFRASAISVPVAPSPPLSGRSAPVIEQADKRSERAPTVVRR